MRIPVTLQPDDYGTLLVTPDLPEVATFGETEADALTRAYDAVMTALSRPRARASAPRPQGGVTPNSRSIVFTSDCVPSLQVILTLIDFVEGGTLRMRLAFSGIE
jgi:predicted RNase H-like HicB family nuclease